MCKVWLPLAFMQSRECVQSQIQKVSASNARALPAKPAALADDRRFVRPGATIEMAATRRSAVPWR
jgi:hypothetical protein